MSHQDSSNLFVTGLTILSPAGSKNNIFIIIWLYLSPRGLVISDHLAGGGRSEDFGCVAKKCAWLPPPPPRPLRPCSILIIFLHWLSIFYSSLLHFVSNDWPPYPFPLKTTWSPKVCIWKFQTFPYATVYQIRNNLF